MKDIEIIADGLASDSESYMIFVDSQAALRAIALVWSRSRVQGILNDFWTGLILSQGTASLGR